MSAVVSREMIGVLGARSLVGEKLLETLRAQEREIVAVSRRPPPDGAPEIRWRRSEEFRAVGSLDAPLWISVLPIWILGDYLPALEAQGVRRVVALSSTSRFGKSASADPMERGVARHLADGEEHFQAWAERNRVEWTILRPTLIYDFGRDQNVTAIAEIVRRYGVFPLLGRANGLRQPVHAEDVAAACVAALEAPSAAGRAYDIPGGETLTYRSMVERVFHHLGRPTRIVTVPRAALRLALPALKLHPKRRHWSIGMADRMNEDLAFDASAAWRDFGYRPREFRLGGG